MSIENDGGPAYPIPDLPMSGNSSSWLSQYTQTSNGMSKREVFAGHALQGLLAGGCRMSEAGKSCWIAADEALAARTEPSAIDVLRKQHELMLFALRACEPFLNESISALSLVSVHGPCITAFEDAIRKVRDALSKVK